MSDDPRGSIESLSRLVSSLRSELEAKETEIQSERRLLPIRRNRLRKGALKFGLSGAAGIAGLVASPFTGGVSAFAIIVPFAVLVWDGLDLYRGIAETRLRASRLEELEREAWQLKERLDRLKDELLSLDS